MADEQPTGWVYLVADFGSRLVKIGFTENHPTSRFKQLQAQCPVPLYRVGRMEGTRQDEQRLHERFARYRVRGEWFTIKGHLRTFLERHGDDWFTDRPTDYEWSVASQAVFGPPA